MTFTFQMSSNNHSPGPRFSSSLFQTGITWFFSKIQNLKNSFIVMNVKMIDDQKLSLVGNLSTSSTFLEIFKNLTAFFFKKPVQSRHSLDYGIIRWRLVALCYNCQRHGVWSLHEMSRFLPRLCACLRFKVPGKHRRRKRGKNGKRRNFKLQKMWNASVFRRDFAFIYQVIQAVTFLYTLFGRHLTFERVT